MKGGSIELKRCPFCGGKAILNDAWPHFVACTRCYARTVNCCQFGEDGERKAVELWNNRWAPETDPDWDNPNVRMAMNGREGND